jgi:hypothetical protein
VRAKKRKNRSESNTNEHSSTHLLPKSFAVLAKSFELRFSRKAMLGYIAYSWLAVYIHPIRLAHQPPASSTFLSEQTSHQQ